MPSMIASPLRLASEGGAPPEVRAAARLWWFAVAIIIGLTLFRLGFGLFDQTDLSTDEAQYWFWGRDLAFGAYSKPPLIAWLIRGATEVVGQSVAAVRLPAAILHGLTALILLWIGKRLGGVEVGTFAALTYLTTPAVALGSALMTTDTPMLFFAALAMASQFALAQAAAEGRKTIGCAILLGAALGLGLLSKHALLFWVVGACAASFASSAFRVRLRDGVVVGATFFLIVLPHLVWLVQHQFITAHHVADITRTGGVSLIRPLAFLAEQTLVMGPLAFLALCLSMLHKDRSTPMMRSESLALALFLAAPLLFVLLQALRGQVFANWAVLYLLPGSLLAGLWFAKHRKMALISIMLAGSLSLALPALKVVGTDLRLPGGKLLLARYLGHSAPVLRALETAERGGAVTLVAQGRSLMADLSWFGRTSPLVLRTFPASGAPTHSWEMTAPLDVQIDPRPVALLWPGSPPPFCPYAAELDRFAAPPGIYEGTTFAVYRIDNVDCLMNYRQAE